MLLFVIWFLIYSYLFDKYRSRVIFFLPVIVIIQKISTELIAINSTEYFRELILLEYGLIFFIIFISLFTLNISGSYKLDVLSKLALFLCVFLLILTFTFSSDPWLSFKRSLKITASLLVFVAVYNIKVTDRDIYLVGKQLYYFIVFFVINILFLSVFNLGKAHNQFVENVTSLGSLVHFGQFNHFECHGIAIITSLLFSLKFLLKKKRCQNILLISSLLVFFVFLIIAKRTYVAIILLGVVFHLLISVFDVRQKTKSSIRVLLIIIISGIILAGTFREFLQARSSENDIEVIANSGRTLELLLYPEVVRDEKNSISFFLFGKELLNSAGKFSIIDNAISKGRQRFLHNDYAHLLYGSGVIGLLVYILILLILLRYSFHNKRIAKNQFEWQISISSIILVLGIFVSGYGDGILSLINRVVPFYALGMFLSYMRKTKNPKY